MMPTAVTMNANTVQGKSSISGMLSDFTKALGKGKPNIYFFIYKN